MDYHTTVLLLITFVSATIILIFIRRLFNQTSESEYAKLPPGPRPFPIIGNILELGTNPHIALTKLSKIYGSLMTFKLGRITTLVISSPQVAKEVLLENGQVLSSRTIPHSVHALDHHIYSTVWLPPSAQWRNLRRVCATKIFSPQLLDSTQILRQQKVHDLLDFVKERCKKGEVIGFCERKMQKILVNVWAIGRDPTIWENPEMFMPERFLECEIDFKGHDFELIPFGTGKRICPGLPLAHRSMHLMVASLVHNFEWKLADGLVPENMNMEEQYGISIKRV